MSNEQTISMGMSLLVAAAAMAVGLLATAHDSTRTLAGPQNEDCEGGLYCAKGGTSPWMPHGTNPMVPWGTNTAQPAGPGYSGNGLDSAF